MNLKAEWRDTAVLYAAMVNPTRLIEQLCEKGDRASLDLAYDCWLENSRRVPEETFTALQELCYQQLETYMVEGDWREADEYNYRVMVQVLGKRFGDYFTKKELMTFPCADLLRIDGLWVRHSVGKFGFSVQKEIYVQCGGKLDGDYEEKSLVNFIQAVGWCKDGSIQYDSFNQIVADEALRSYEKFIFSSEKSVIGHLPLVRIRFTV